MFSLISNTFLSLKIYFVIDLKVDRVAPSIADTFQCKFTNSQNQPI